MTTAVEVVGILGDAGNARGGYPVRVTSNISDAVQMRFGNTLEEASSSEWLSYQSQADWVIQTGTQPKLIYYQFQLSDGSVVDGTVDVPNFDPSLGTNYAWPTASVVQSGSVLWRQNFDTGHDYWVSYDYNGGVAVEVNFENVFFPTTWASAGGVDGGGYIWADDSRWRVDTPESPDLVAPLSIQGQFVSSDLTFSNFDGATARFSLRGENLDLHGGQAYFWVMDEHGRVLNLGQPLSIVDGVWTSNEVHIASLNDDDWQVSFLPFPGSIDATRILAWGIAFEGFSSEPSGRIDLDNFSIELLADPADPHGPIKSGAEITVKRDTGIDGADPAAPPVSNDSNATEAASFSNGGANIVWTDADTHTVYAQLMTADGGKYVDRIEIATNAADAVVGSLQNGFVVAWDDLGNGGTAPSIMGRLFDRDGGALVDLQISSPGTDSDTDPSLAVSDSANFIVTWTREDAGRDVYARVFGEDGQPLGQEFAITATGTVLGRSVVTALASGAFFVAWEDSDHNDPADPSGTHISGRIVHSDGTVDAPFVVNSTSSGDQSDLAVVSLSTGGFLVVWLDGSESPSNLIRARAFDANGNPIAQDFVVAHSDIDVIQDIAAAALPDGQFVVSWTDVNASTSTSDIHARMMSADGSAVSDPFIVNYVTAGQGNEGHSSVTVLADGRIMVTWTDGDAVGSAIRAQIFDQRSAGVTLAGTADNGDWVGTAFSDSFFPGGGVNHIVGGAGDDLYYLSGSNDTIIERAGQGDHDRILVSFDYEIPALAQVEELNTTDSAGTAAIHLTGNEFANSITGNAGNNWLNNGGSAGPADTLMGLDGDDWYFVYRTSDVVIEAPGAGNDRVFAAVDYTLAAGQAIETLSTTDNGGTAPLHLTGNEFANTVAGNAGDNVLDGGRLGATDTLIGLGGDDTYLVHRSTDVVVEDPGAGTDTVRTDVSYVLAAGQEIEALLASDDAGTAPLLLTGNEFGNTLGGNVGAANTLIGESGDDTYLVRNGTDTVIEASGGGTDTVRTDVSYMLAPGQEIEALLASDDAGTAQLVLTGNEFANTIGGNVGAANTLIGLGGDDAYLVRNSTDIVIEAAGGGSDTVRSDVSYTLAAGQEIEALAASDSDSTTPLRLAGNELFNIITGNAGDNWLNYHGSLGPADRLIGLGGDDWYFVYRSNQVVAEALGGGNDRVFAAVDYTLAAGQQIEMLSTDNNGGTAPLHLTGNEFANTIAGNAGTNILDGGLSGAADTLIGMEGDDTYLVHHSNDGVIEAAGGGTDTVRTDVNYALTAGQEIETLSAANTTTTTPLRLAGNEFANTLIGNAGDNWLDGSADAANSNLADALVGGQGNDWYFVRNAADSITELAGQGTLDRVFASTSYNLAAGVNVEILSTANQVGTEAINLRGNELAQTLVGNAGTNMISGGLGNDTLTGLGGNDYFMFEAAPGLGNIDRITDFTIGQDHMLMLHSAFSSLSAGTLADTHFLVRGSAFQGADDFIFYDPSSGGLFYDADGSGAGAAQQFATVTANLNLHASDFIVV